MKVFNNNGNHFKFSLLGGDDEKLSFLERFLGIVIAPKDTLIILSRSIEYTGLVVVIFLSSLIYNGLLYSNLGNAMSNIIQFTKAGITQDKANILAQEWSVIGVFLMAVFTIIGWMVGGLVLYFAVRIFGEIISLNQMMIIVGNSYFIVVIYYILSMMVCLISGQFYLNASLAVIVPGLKGTYIYGILRTIDIFNVWQYWVISNGISGVAEIESKRAILIVSIVLIIFSVSAATIARFIN